MPEDHRGRRCIALLSASLNRLTLTRYRRLVAALGASYDCVLLLADELHEAAAALPLHDAVCLGADDIFLPAYGAKSASRKIVPGNPDLAVLALHRARPHYEHIWLIEHDVFFPDGPEVLAALDAATEAELVVPFGLQSRAQSPDWFWWRSFGPPEGVAAAPEACFRSLLCVMRLGGRLLRALDLAYRAGWHGHFEATVPTIARHQGLAFDSLRVLGPRALGRQAITATAFHFQACAPDPASLIFHPVKTLAEEAALREGRS